MYREKVGLDLHVEWLWVVDAVRVGSLEDGRFLRECRQWGQMRVHGREAAAMGEHSWDELHQAFLGSVFEFSAGGCEEDAVSLSYHGYLAILYACKQELLAWELIMSRFRIILVRRRLSLDRVKLEWYRWEDLVHNIDLSNNLQILCLLNLVEAKVAIERGRHNSEHLLLDLCKWNNLLIRHNTILAVFSLLYGHHR